MIIWHFIVFIVTIFCFAYAFYCLSDVKCFALLSRDYLAFYCVYRDFILFCICFYYLSDVKCFALLSRDYLAFYLS